VSVCTARRCRLLHAADAGAKATAGVENTNDADADVDDHLDGDEAARYACVVCQLPSSSRRPPRCSCRHRPSRPPSSSSSCT